MIDRRKSKRSIETLLFDFGGTLDADGTAWKERFYVQCQVLGLDMSAEAFAPAFYAADNPLIGALPPNAGLSHTARCLSANLKHEIVRRGDSDLARIGEWDERIAEGFLEESFGVFARNRPILEALSARYRLGIVSNFYGNLEAVCEEAGLAPYFGAIVDSHLVGVEKPDPAILQSAFDQLGANPRTTVLIGDSLKRDREVAVRKGIDFVWLASPEARAGEALRSGGVPGYPVLSTFAQLAGMLT